jgi:hypothetical protein
LVGDRPSLLIVLTISGSAATVLLLLGGLAEQGFDGGDHVCGTVLAGDPTGQLPCPVAELAVGDRRVNGVGELVRGQ